MRKKTTMLLIAIMLVTTILAGCGANEGAGNASGETGNAALEGESNFNKEGLPIVNEPITLDVLTVRWGSMGDTFTKNQWLMDLEASTNVKINWQVMSSNDWNEQKSIMMASGELPDVILGNIALTDSDIVNNLSYFRPLDEYIDQYMPNLKAALEETPEMKRISTFPDGKIYSLPTRLPARPISSFQPVINKAWLDRLGLKVPETIDDLYNVLKAFKEQDANGNGDPNDEIPYSSKGLEVNLISSFGITDLNNTKMMIKDGKPVFYPVTEEYKEALKWLHKLYSEGLLDQETFTQDDTMLSAKRQNPDVSLIGFTHQWIPDAVFGQWKDEYVTIPPIAGPDGQRYQVGDPNGLNLNRNELLITTFNEYPEVTARWADQFYTNEASIQNFWGAFGTVTSKNDDGSYSLLNPPEGISADAWYWESSLRDFGPKYVSPDFEKKIIFDATAGDGLKLELDKIGRDYVTTPYPKVMYTSEEFAELPTLTTDIDGFITSTTAQWVTQGGIDEGWDAYVKQLNDMGLERLIQIRTDAYERYMK